MVIVLAVLLVELGGNVGLAFTLLFEAFQVDFQVYFFLSAVKLSKALFEKIVSHVVVLGFTGHDFLGGLVVAKLSSFSDD